MRRGLWCGRQQNAAVKVERVTGLSSRKRYGVNFAVVLAFVVGVCLGLFVAVLHIINVAAVVGQRDTNQQPFSMRGLFDATGIPMYYINLDRSVERRRYIERYFGGNGNVLRRVVGVDAKEAGEVERWMIGGGSIDTTRFTGCNHSEYITDAMLQRCYDATRGELALSISHWKAVKTAADDGCEVALIVEDDVSPILTNMWVRSLQGVVTDANLNHPEWQMIRLQWHAAGSRTYWHDTLRWREAPDGYLYGGRYSLYGLAAYLVNRKGMSRVLDGMSSSDKNSRNLFDCLRRNDYIPYPKRNPLGCVADELMPKLFTDEEVLRVMPPMFTYKYFEESTGVRDTADIRVGYHEQSVSDSVRLAVQNVEMWLERWAATLEPHFGDGDNISRNENDANGLTDDANHDGRNASATADVVGLVKRKRQTRWRVEAAPPDIIDQLGLN